MAQLVFSPNWFFGKDIIMDIVAVIVLLLIGGVSIKYYNILGKENKRHLYLGFSYIMLALSFLAKILTNFTLYYQVHIVKQIKTLLVVQYATQASGILFFLGFLFYHLFLLWGLYTLYAVLSDETKKSNVMLSFFLIAVLTYFTNRLYYVFHATALFILILIIIRYKQAYSSNKNQNTKRLITSFSLLALSQAAFIFVKVSNIIYVAAEIIQLAGFILLLIALFKVLKHGKKKKQDRHHK